jgi:ubiquitin-like protein Pup
MSQTQKNKSAPSKQESKTKDAKDLKNEELDESTTDIIDEIDEILEENAEEFVANYVQRGGQ